MPEHKRWDDELLGVRRALNCAQGLDRQVDLAATGNGKDSPMSPHLFEGTGPHTATLTAIAKTESNGSVLFRSS